MNPVFRWLILALAAGLVSCASNTDMLFKSAQNLLDVARGAEVRPTNPNFSYLRLMINGHVAFLVRGNVDAEGGGPVEVWYSADRAVLRLREGRVAGATGLIAEWRQVTQPDAPAWRDAARETAQLTWTRVRDVMPGYQFGVRDSMSLRRIAAPRDSALLDISPDSLVWFEESVASGTLPPARYAVDFDGPNEVVVYGEQCLSDTLCFSWQRWSVTPPVQ